jgi:Tfp pilus assembly protein PilE
MESRSARSCVFRPRLRTLLVAVALVGLLLAVVVREAHFRAELQRERARAEANLQKARAAVDRYYSQVAEQSAAPVPQNDQLRRELLERSLKFYQGMESKASSPEERARILDRMQQIRTKLEREEQSDDGPPWRDLSPTRCRSGPGPPRGMEVVDYSWRGQSGAGRWWDMKRVIQRSDLPNCSVGRGRSRTHMPRKLQSIVRGGTASTSHHR